MHTLLGVIRNMLEVWFGLGAAATVQDGETVDKAVQETAGFLGLGAALETFAAWREDNPFLAELVGASVLLVLGFVGWAVLRPLLPAVARRVTSKTSFKWDDLIVEAGVVGRAAMVIPALIILGCYRAEVLGLSEDLESLVGNVAAAWIVLAIMATVLAILDLVQLGYHKRERHKRHPIKGYVQLAKIFVVLIGIIAGVAKLVGAELGSLFVGMGALTAVIMLVFKDTILAFVASLQISSNDLVRIGDWIEVPGAKADGDVIDIALHTVKVQNWDKTITTVPTYELFANSFKNWRGMTDGDGRRIKRSITLDVQSVRFLEDEDLDRLSKIAVLSDYLEEKRAALRSAERRDDEVAANRRRLTNLGTFRAYIAAYLRSRKDLNEDMTFLVRQLEPTAAGVPIEVYVFTKTKAWVEYEGIQSDIFDHLLAIVSEFDLRVFQQPSGENMRALAASLGERSVTNP